jgi:hypothetical protein
MAHDSKKKMLIFARLIDWENAYIGTLSKVELRSALQNLEPIPQSLHLCMYLHTISALALGRFYKKVIILFKNNLGFDFIYVQLL